MTHMEHVQALRASLDPHYNCCQSVLVPFAREMGLTEAQAYALGTNFGSGMGNGLVCGTLSGAFLVLGAAGFGPQKAVALLRQFQAEHEATDCRTLLKASHDRGEERKAHCDGLVYEIVAALEGILDKKA
ncbi:MAG: C_GCAxxG_C_C family protein [Lawsonibacter sp.]|nr:C_GCAxxG_C_C family protein [Lawsonibacter sp.]